MPIARQRRTQPRQPGYDGKRVMVGALVDAVYERGKTEPVVRNVGEGPLTMLRSRGDVDMAQEKAGDWFRKTYEQTRAGSMAVDPSHEPVDTSGIADPIPIRMIEASQKLAEARAEIGRDGYRMVELVCGEGWTIAEASWNKSKIGKEQYGFLLRISLKRLAVWLGYAAQMY